MAFSHVFPTYHVMIFRSYGQNLSANPSSAFSAPFEACSWRHLWVTWGPKIRLKNLWPFKDGVCVCVCKLRPPFALSWRTFALSLKVVFGMRLIRRPWKGCRFWDVPFTIPWKGCKFQKWGFPKWGYRIWNFLFFNVLHMEEAHVAYVVVWWSGGGGGVGGGVSRGGMLTFRGGGGGWEGDVSSASITLRKRHMFYMLSYDGQGGVGGVGGVSSGGDVNVRVERFHHVTEEAHVVYVVVWWSGGLRMWGGWGGGGGGMLTFVSSPALPSRYGRGTCSICCRMMVRGGVGGWGGC